MATLLKAYLQKTDDPLLMFKALLESESDFIFESDFILKEDKYTIEELESYLQLTKVPRKEKRNAKKWKKLQQDKASIRVADMTKKKNQKRLREFNEESEKHPIAYTMADKENLKVGSKISEAKRKKWQEKLSELKEDKKIDPKESDRKENIKFLTELKKVTGFSKDIQRQLKELIKKPDKDDVDANVKLDLISTGLLGDTPESVYAEENRETNLLRFKDNLEHYTTPEGEEDYKNTFIKNLKEIIENNPKADLPDFVVKDGKEINWVETKKGIQDIKTYFPLLQKILNAITIPTSQKGKKTKLRPKLVTEQIEGGKPKKDKKPKSLDEKSKISLKNLEELKRKLRKIDKDKVTEGVSESVYLDAVRNPLDKLLGANPIQTLSILKDSFNNEDSMRYYNDVKIEEIEEEKLESFIKEDWRKHLKEEFEKLQIPSEYAQKEGQGKLSILGRKEKEIFPLTSIDRKEGESAQDAFIRIKEKDYDEFKEKWEPRNKKGEKIKLYSDDEKYFKLDKNEEKINETKKKIHDELNRGNVAYLDIETGKKIKKKLYEAIVDTYEADKGVKIISDKARSTKLQTGFESLLQAGPKKLEEKDYDYLGIEPWHEKDEIDTNKVITDTRRELRTHYDAKNVKYLGHKMDNDKNIFLFRVFSEIPHPPPSEIRGMPVTTYDKGNLPKQASVERIQREERELRRNYEEVKRGAVFSKEKLKEINEWANKYFSPLYEKAKQGAVFNKEKLKEINEWAKKQGLEEIEGEKE